MLKKNEAKVKKRLTKPKHAALTVLERLVIEFPQLVNGLDVEISGADFLDAASNAIQSNVALRMHLKAFIKR